MTEHDNQNETLLAADVPSDEGDTPSLFGFSPLDDVQARALGVLIEKQLSTPEYYPLTLKSALAACNQKSNRFPVMALDEKVVSRALEHLREKKLIWMVHTAGSRAVKYEHKVDERIFLNDRAEMSVVAELLLRGPQTPGQLRSRTERMHVFSDKEEVQRVLENLASRGVPLVVRLPQLPGHKECRYTHLLSGVPAQQESPSGMENQVVHIPATEDAALIAELQEKVACLESRVAELETDFASFRKQFE